MSTIDLSSSQSLRKRVLLAGALNIGSIVASQVIRLGGNLIITRLLLPEMFGLMAIATTVSVLLLLLSDVGLRQNIIQSPEATSRCSSTRSGRCRSFAALGCSW